MALAAFENLLKQTMGLDAASIGSSAIEHAVQERLSACHLKDSDSYWERVCASETELQELVEALVVPETWFFRHPEAFAALVRLVWEEWLPSYPEGLLRLLSLPCSTGEEPNSMAMALFDAGFPADRFDIDAIDISARALARAERGLYGRNSFRGDELGFRDRHFEPTAHGHRLDEAVRRRVHFQHGNVFAAGFLPGTELYDVIFFRNVLIYFDRPTQDRVIRVLRRLLRAQGFLFVGPSESHLLLSHGFVSAKLPLAFAFRKGTAASRESAPAIGHALKHPPAARPLAPPRLHPNPHECAQDRLPLRHQIRRPWASMKPSGSPIKGAWRKRRSIAKPMCASTARRRRRFISSGWYAMPMAAKRRPPKPTARCSISIRTTTKP